MTIKIPKNEALDILWDDNGAIIRDKIISKSRWSIRHELIFIYTDRKYYRTTYQEGATEYQDENPWQYVDEVECTEVEPFQETVTNFRPIE